MLKKKLSLLLLPAVAAVSLQAQSPMNDPFFSDPFGDNIFKEMMQMQQQMDEMFKRMEQRMYQRSTRLVSPLGTYKLGAQSQFVDRGDHYVLVTNIPESKENHIDIKTENGTLYISAKIVHTQEQKSNGVVSSSRSVQMFQQSSTLPADADESKIKTAYEKGRLVVSIAKKAGAAKAAVQTPAQAQQPASQKVEKKALETKTEEKVTLPKIDEHLKSAPKVP